jgi:predicted Zn-dependent peptidase
MEVLMPYKPGHWLVAALVASAPLLSQEIPILERTLPNGMRVLLVERHDQPTIAAGWVARVGSANERPGITGIAHLFEHMMFKGTTTIGTKDARRDAELNVAQDKVQAEIRKEISILREKQRRGEIKDLNDPKVRSERHQTLLADYDKLVAEQRSLVVKDEMDKIYTQAGARGLNAGTSNDFTVYMNEVPANKLELWTWIESDRLAAHVFREFYSERNVVLEERRQSLEATPTGRFEEAFNAMVWMASPYHWQVVGWPSDISQVTREQAEEHFATYYAPNNITAVLVGDFQPEEAMKLMARYFGRIPANPKGAPEIITMEPPQPAEQRMYAEAETTPSVRITYKAVAGVHRDSPALQVLGGVLNGRSGRLYKELVLNQKVATNAGGYAQGQKLAGTFTLTGTASADRRPEDVEKALLAEAEKIQKDGITDYELQKVKNQSQAAAYARLENNMGVMIQLAISEASGNYRDFLESPKQVALVTREDVQRVARQYLTRENRNVLIYTRKKVEGGAPVDPELAKLPEQLQNVAKAQMAQIGTMDLAKCKETLAQAEAQATQVPEQVKPLVDYLIKKIRERIQKLEAK